MTIRERTELYEEQNFSPFASLAKKSLGRARAEEKCDIRTYYQQDRDRIVHSKAFRRLKGKTQVFIAPEGDHYRTRMTHTFEVSQVARTLARALRLNEDLTEAVALGHDLGHTPFGHAGEDALNKICPLGFRHFEQSLRVIEKLEKSGNGLNLTQEVKDGILCHTRGPEAFTLEGRIVRLADKIAYINHDTDDALRAGILKEEEIPENIIKTLGKTRSERVNTIIRSLVDNTLKDEVLMAKQVDKAFWELHAFIFKIIEKAHAKLEEKKVPEFIEKFYIYFKNNPEKLPEESKKIAKSEGIDRAVCDYIACMTDNFAIEFFKEIFVPKFYQIRFK